MCFILPEEITRSRALSRGESDVGGNNRKQSSVSPSSRRFVAVHSQDDFVADSRKAKLLGAPATSTLSATTTSDGGSGGGSTSTVMKKVEAERRRRSKQQKAEACCCSASIIVFGSSRCFYPLGKEKCENIFFSGA
ncbi:uncharacterized protein G2W53_005354 [Senna tora]|uniref:Uncharacterized protein n=1 Tax=Senna tora TaxID=362788 RepID=A0A835CH94_9FABA|nr:uncharacterized protein G2W53_005354 [Senna tora]